MGERKTMILVLSYGPMGARQAIGEVALVDWWCSREATHTLLTLSPSQPILSLFLSLAL